MLQVLPPWNSCREHSNFHEQSNRMRTVRWRTAMQHLSLQKMQKGTIRRYVSERHVVHRTSEPGMSHTGFSGQHLWLVFYDVLVFCNHQVFLKVSMKILRYRLTRYDDTPSLRETAAPCDFSLTQCITPWITYQLTYFFSEEQCYLSKIVHNAKTINIST
jgi:hypothetical protein